MSPVSPKRYVRHSAGESVWQCSQCGRSKLYVNENKGTGFCFYCGEGCKVKRANVSPLLQIATRLPSVHTLDSRAWDLIKGRLQRPILAKLDSRFPAKRMMPMDTPGIPLYIGGEIVGVSLYHGEYGDPRYTVQGTRGLAYTETGKEYPHTLLLLEGFFDFLNVYSLLRGQNLGLVYSAGNGLSDVQIEHLLGLSVCTSSLVIAWDNDRISVAESLARDLACYAKCVVRVCPLAWGKDYDEAIRQGYGEKVSRYLLMGKLPDGREKGK